MASSYPGSLDAFDSIASDKKTSDVVGGRTHRDMHNDLGDAVEAIQAELGTDPAGSFATVKARLDQLVAYAAKTGAYTATVADRTLNVTSGTFTLDLPAASTCTGQSLKVRNSGTGVVTLDGNSSETVAGVATFPLGGGSYVEITSTGSAWILTGGTPDTGWRDISGSVSAISGVTYTYAYLRRHGNSVTLHVRLSAANSVSASPMYTTPTGFRFRPSVADFWLSFFDVNGNRVELATDAGASFTVKCVEAATTAVQLLVNYPTSDNWPTSLPGA